MARASSIILQPPVWLDAPPLMQHGRFDAVRLDDEVGRWTAPSGLRLKALRGGRLTFAFVGTKYDPQTADGAPPDFAALGAAHRERIVAINAYLTALYLAVQDDMDYAIKKYIARPLQMMSAVDFESAGYGWAGQDISLGYLTAASYSHQYSPDLPMEADPRIFGRSHCVITKATLDKAFATYMSLEGLSLTNSFEVLDLYLRALVNCEEHDYAASLISSWAVIERFVELRWRASLDRRLASGSITQDRKSRIAKDSRTYTAAIRLEILETAGDIEAGVYTNTSSLRKVRNDWIHSLRAVTMQDAILGLVVAARWFKIETGVDIELQPALQLGGL